MRGEIKITYCFANDKKELNLGSNMLVDQAGELLADALTISPSLSSIPTASAILDTSNYTVHAMTLGKSSEGYRKHAHSKDVSSMVLTDGIVRVLSKQTANVSSYDVTTHATQLSKFPSPEDTRLEISSTEDLFSTFNLGHNLNMIFASASNGLGLSAALVGCYPTSSAGGTNLAIVSSTTITDPIYASGNYRSRLNELGFIDQSGFIHVTQSKASNGNGAAKNEEGVYITHKDKNGALSVATSSFTDYKDSVNYNLSVSGGDFAFSNVFGGIYNVGLWYLDMKKLLCDGLTPPYSFDALNNPRNYKLFAKKSFSEDLTKGQDLLGASVMGEFDSAGVVEDMLLTWSLEF